MSVAESEARVPLVVDVDGALLRTDLLWEGLVRVAVRQPASLPSVLGARVRGRMAFRRAVAEASGLSVSRVPVDPAVMALVQRATAAGRPVLLTSSASWSELSDLAERLGAEVLDGPSVEADGPTNGNTSATTTLARIRARHTTFDYVGSGPDDLPVWAEARRAFAVDPGARTVRTARRLRPDLEVVRGRSGLLGATIRALRPHHWSKNALLFLPAMAAHLQVSAAEALTLVAGFIAFSAMASAVYVVNDLVDLPNDRAHASKRQRPLAAGELPIPLALGLVVSLTVLAVAVALRLPRTFLLVLGVYLALTTTYSLVLKQRAILDVITLAGLYATRVVAGAVLVAVPLSRWFLAFSVFFFFSLALVKRVIELARHDPEDTSHVPGRGYLGIDRPVLTSLGTTAVMASALVYCLYITGEEVGAIYERPDLLWLGLPILLYWQSRLWLLAGRNALHDDPVVFALRDRMSQILFVAFLGVVWAAA